MTEQDLPTGTATLPPQHCGTQTRQQERADAVHVVGVLQMKGLTLHDDSRLQPADRAAIELRQGGEDIGVEQGKLLEARAYLGDASGYLPEHGLVCGEFSLELQQLDGVPGQLQVAPDTPGELIGKLAGPRGHT